MTVATAKEGCYYELARLLAVVAVYYFVLAGLISLSPGAAGWSTVALAPFGLFLVNATTSKLRGSPELRALARAGRLASPRDGELVALHGELTCGGEPLNSPFAQVPCCAYEYEISKPDADAEGSPCWAVQYRGFANAPTALETALGRFDLSGFSFGTLANFEPVGVDAERALGPAAEYIEKADFSPEPLSGAAPLKRALSEVVQTPGDSAGASRVDLRRSDARLDGDLRFTESVLPPGRELIAVGVFSAERRALLTSGTGVLQLWPGDIATTRRKLKAGTGSAWLMALAMVLFSHGAFAALVATGAVR